MTVISLLAAIGNTWTTVFDSVLHAQRRDAMHFLRFDKNKLRQGFTIAPGLSKIANSLVDGAAPALHKERNYTVDNSKSQ